MEQQRRISVHASHEMNDKKKINAKGKERMTRRLIVEEDEREDINELADACIINACWFQYSSKLSVKKPKMAKNLSNQAACMKHNRDISMYASNEMNREKNESTNTKINERITRRLNAENEKKDVNELADAFIKKFHDRLRIERAESFKRYKEMIARRV
ncbi:T4.17 protein [Melia azedarach]|uniref:T4.17 protein n=2 Tax=Melia azedarach TaxID=155640 RepID=A0ACC1XTC0_MELAZ|nr:T4.17 protein [Melia azedarach]KAJ4714388.1 T4.17 protein [Melia azedarach]